MRCEGVSDLMLVSIALEAHVGKRCVRDHSSTKDALIEGMVDCRTARMEAEQFRAFEDDAAEPGRFAPPVGELQTKVIDRLLYTAGAAAGITATPPSTEPQSANSPSRTP